MQYLLNNFQNVYNTLRPDGFLDLKSSGFFSLTKYVAKPKIMQQNKKRSKLHPSKKNSQHIIISQVNII